MLMCSYTVASVQICTVIECLAVCVLPVPLTVEVLWVSKAATQSNHSSIMLGFNKLNSFNSYLD